MSYDTIEHVYDRLAEGDFQTVFDSLSTLLAWIEAEDIPSSPGEPIKTSEGIQGTVFDELGKDFADFHIDVNRTAADDDAVLVEGRCVGTTNTQKDLDAIVAHGWDSDDGKVVRVQQYSDAWQWRNVLGVDG